MNIEEKRIMIEKYIIQSAERLNLQYPNILPEDSIKRGIEMFQDLPDEYDVIFFKIDEMIERIIENYLRMKEEEKNKFSQGVDQNDRESRTFSEIKQSYEIMQSVLQRDGLKIFVSGGTVPYLLLDQESNRLHDDIDTVCRMEDMQLLRQAFKNAGFYDPEWDSINYSKDGRDYGFEIKIEGVPIGIYPFTYKDGQLVQYSYDPYNHSCKIKQITLHELSDYICSYIGVNGNTYYTMSLEYIKKTKDRTGRTKDIQDSAKISEIGIRREVLDRITLPKEIQNVAAEELNNDDDGR